MSLDEITKGESIDREGILLTEPWDATTLRDGSDKEEHILKD